jgi:leucyl-tRNA synthetase
MAYYTVAHILHPGDLFGDGKNNAVPPEMMTNDVWDALFYGRECPAHFPPDVLERMRREFEYWYPLDLRASGRDLVQNHLSFSVYNHTALFERKHWPRSFRCNGHVMLNNDKMSKSSGNFLTIQRGVQMYSADAMRFALADAGDGLDDANFEESNANAAILRLTKELNWMQEMLSPGADLRDQEGSYFADRAFANEINFKAQETYHAYEHFMFREALKAGFFDLMVRIHLNFRSQVLSYHLFSRKSHGERACSCLCACKSVVCERCISSRDSQCEDESRTY